MAQRWMQAKMQIAKTHGTTRSGAGRAIGHVREDMPGRAPAEKIVTPVKPRKKAMAVAWKTERPTPWGKGRAHRRAAQNTK